MCLWFFRPTEVGDRAEVDGVTDGVMTAIDDIAIPNARHSAHSGKDSAASSVSPAGG